MILKMIVMFLLVFSTSTFAEEIKFEDLDSDIQEELLSGLNSKERAAAGFVKKSPPKEVKNYVKKPLVKKIVPDIAFQKAVARQLEMEKLDFEVEAAKKKMADDASKKAEPALPTVVVTRPSKQEVKAQVVSKVLIPKPVFNNFVKSLSPLELGVSLKLSAYRNEEAINPERGFGMASSNQTGMRLGLSVQAKYKMFGLEFVPFTSSDKLDLEFYGSSLGSLEIVTGPALITKVFVLDDAKYSLFLGLGIESVKVKGAFSIGGFEAVTKYNKTPTIVQIGGLYKLNPDIALGINYEISNLRISSEFPGVPAQVFNRGACLVFTGNYRFLKP